MIPPGASFEVSAEGDEAPVPAEARTQVFLILREAIRNAVTHSDCSRITVRLQVLPEAMVCSVEDDGQGFQTHALHPADHNGLKSMEERASLLGGTLGVSSTPGRGTTIQVTVPLGSVMKNDGRIRVLLADDHTMFRQGLKEMLSTDGEIEIVGEADNGRDAVALARESKPDVVILDVEMPVMGAAEAMEKILGISPRPRILIVTMFDNPRLVRELLAKGASGYLVKSASLEELLGAVRAAAQSARARAGRT